MGVLDEAVDEGVEGGSAFRGGGGVLGRLWRGGVVVLAAVGGGGFVVARRHRDDRGGGGHQVVDHFGTHGLVQENVQSFEVRHSGGWVSSWSTGVGAGRVAVASVLRCSHEGPAGLAWVGRGVLLSRHTGHAHKHCEVQPPGEAPLAVSTAESAIYLR